MTEKEKIKECLEQINKFVMENCGEDNPKIYYIRSALRINHRFVDISFSRCGIVAKYDGKFAPWMRIGTPQDALERSSAGKEIVLNWQSIKKDFLGKLQKDEEDMKQIFNFSV